MAFKLRSGNTTSFKEMGGSPFMKADSGGKSDKGGKPDKPDKPDKKEKTNNSKPSKEKTTQSTKNNETKSKDTQTPSAQNKQQDFINSLTEQAGVSNIDLKEQSKTKDKKADTKVQEPLPPGVGAAPTEDGKPAGPVELTPEQQVKQNIDKKNIEINKQNAIMNELKDDTTSIVKDNLKQEVKDKTTKAVVTNPIVQKQLARKAALKLAGKVALKFVPGVGMASTMWDLGKLGAKAWKNRQEIAGWTKRNLSLIHI